MSTRKNFFGRINTVLIPVFSVALIVLCVVFQTASAEMVYTSTQPIQYAVDRNGTWIREGEQLLYWADGETRPHALASAENITHLAAGGGVLYYTTEHEDGTALIHAESSDGYTILSGTPVKASGEILQIEADETTVYLLLEALEEDHHEHGVGDLYRLDPWTGDCEPLVLDEEFLNQISAFSIYDHMLICADQEGARLRVINLQTRTELFEPVFIPEVSYIQWGYQSGEGCYLLGVQSSDGKLIEINAENGNIKELTADLPSPCFGLRRDDIWLYTLDESFQKLYRKDLSELFDRPANNTLTIVNSLDEGTPWFETAKRLFHEKYPDIVIMTRRIDDPRIMATELMAGATDLDVISVQENMMPSCSAMMLKAGAIDEIGSDDEITQWMGLYEDIWQLTSANGRMYGIPEGIDQELWVVDEALAKEIGWESPADYWTWDDFTELANLVKSRNEKASEPVLLFKYDGFPEILRQYMYNHVNPYMGTADFRTEELKQLLTMWKTLTADGLIASNDSEHTLQRALLQTEDMIQVGYTGLARARYVLPPVTDESTQYAVHVTALEVNAHSAMREEARYFLACYLSAECMTDKLLYGSLNGIAREEEPFWKQFPMQVDEETVQKNVHLWKYGLTHGVPDYGLFDILAPQSEELLPALLNDTITLDEFIASSERLAWMMLED